MPGAPNPASVHDHRHAIGTSNVKIVSWIFKVWKSRFEFPGQCFAQLVVHMEGSSEAPVAAGYAGSLYVGGSMASTFGAGFELSKNRALGLEGVAEGCPRRFDFT